MAPKVGATVLFGPVSAGLGGVAPQLATEVGVQRGRLNLVSPNSDKSSITKIARLISRFSVFDPIPYGTSRSSMSSSACAWSRSLASNSGVGESLRLGLFGCEAVLLCLKILLENAVVVVEVEELVLVADQFPHADACRDAPLRASAVLAWASRVSRIAACSAAVSRRSCICARHCAQSPGRKSVGPHSVPGWTHG